jgi:hypothetical protein
MNFDNRNGIEDLLRKVFNAPELAADLTSNPEEKVKIEQQLIEQAEAVFLLNPDLNWHDPHTRAQLTLFISITQVFYSKWNFFCARHGKDKLTN